jgi:hypothetical protein
MYKLYDVFNSVENRRKIGRPVVLEIGTGLAWRSTLHMILSPVCAKFDQRRNLNFEYFENNLREIIRSSQHLWVDIFSITVIVYSALYLYLYGVQNITVEYLYCLQICSKKKGTHQVGQIRIRIIFFKMTVISSQSLNEKL